MSHKKDSLFPFKLVFHSRLVIKRSSLYHAGFFFSFPSKQDQLHLSWPFQRNQKVSRPFTLHLSTLVGKRGCFHPFPLTMGILSPLIHHSHVDLPHVSCLFMCTSNQFKTPIAPTTIQSIFSNSWLILSPPPRAVSPKKKNFNHQILLL